MRRTSLTFTSRRTTIGLAAFASLGVGCLSDIHRVDRRSSSGGYDQSGEGRTEVPAATSVPTGFAPEFGPTVRQTDPPPPISGGTLALTSDGKIAVAADPDRDAVSIVNLDTGVVRSIALRLHDEPGRVAIDDAGRAHVALRRGGALVTIDLATAEVVSRRSACPLPRGVAWDSKKNRVHVACAGGELVTLPAGDGAATSVIQVMPDLRDVVVGPTGLVVSTFRRAEVVVLDESSAVETVTAPKVFFGARTASSHVAWRMVAIPETPTPTGDADVLVAAQAEPDDDVETPPQYYESSDGCSANGPVTLLRFGTQYRRVPQAVLPVDVAASARYVAVVSAANAHTPQLDTIHVIDRGWFHGSGNPCVIGEGIHLRAQVTSVAFTPDGESLVALSREPAALHVIPMPSHATTRTIALSDASREDTGHAIFHANAGTGVACASCHPEGRDDGHVWRSTELGGRRTPSLLGTLAGTAPYHWNGEARDMRELANLTFSSRMRGPALRDDQKDALGGWLPALPPLTASPARDAAAAARGQALFDAKCAACHSGAARTNNASLDVGTGGTFQVPSLVNVGFRAPFFHDGRATSLAAVPTSWAHPGASVDKAQSRDLAAFLETL
jgi:mono/diheme cytochrome c family protein